MSLLISAVFDQEGSGRTELTERFLQCLLQTVNFNNHRFVIIDNGSCLATKMVLGRFAGHFSAMGEYPQENLIIITNEENVGTAKAINQGLKLRQKEEHCLKIDNDIIIDCDNWVEQLEEAINRAPEIGILGLKRKDLIEAPWHTDINYRSLLIMLEHKPGEPWIIFERVKGVMGTCTMYNWRLLDKIGYLWQPAVYGYDDSLVSLRSGLAGFMNGFLPHIRLDHPDPGNTFYQEWKFKQAEEFARLSHEAADDYTNGRRPIYEGCE